MATSTVSVNDVDESIFENKDVKVSAEQCRCPSCSKEGISLKECYDFEIENYKKYGDASKSVYEIEHTENFDKRFIAPGNPGSGSGPLSKLGISIIGLMMGIQLPHQLPHIEKIMLDKTDNPQSQHIMQLFESMSGMISLLSYVMIIMSLGMLVINVLLIYKKKEFDDEYEAELKKYNNSRYCKSCNHVYEIVELKSEQLVSKIKSKAHGQKKKK